MMIAMKNLTNTAPASEALIRIYQSGKVVINAPAKKLLNLEDSSRILFRESETGFDRYVYVGRSDHDGYPLSPCGRRYKICSSDLCRKMAQKLQGYGTYRIEFDNPVEDYSGATFYPIFFKKYV